MTELPDDRKNFKIGLAVQTQYRRVSDRHATTAKTAFTHSFAREKIVSKYLHFFYMYIFQYSTKYLSKPVTQKKSYTVTVSAFTCARTHTGSLTPLVNSRVSK